MTYIVGWKKKAAAFLCADSVVTVTNPSTPLRFELSSFGERHVLTKQESISEGLLKIINLGSVAVAYCGNVGFNRGICGLIATELHRGSCPRDAFVTAIKSSLPVPPGIDTGLLAVFVEDSKPVFLAFNEYNDCQIQDVADDHCVMMGSMPEGITHIDVSCLAMLDKAFADKPAEYLVSMLGCLQSWSLHTPVLSQHGVGGAFYGLMATSSGIHWQPDVTYWPYAYTDGISFTGNVYTFFRENSLVVRSFITETTRVFSDELSGQHSRWRDLWALASRDIGAGLSFDFVVALDRLRTTVTLFRANAGARLPYLDITVSPISRDQSGFRFNVSLSETIARAMLEAVPDPPPGPAFPIRFNWFDSKVQRTSVVLDTSQQVSKVTLDGLVPSV